MTTKILSLTITFLMVLGLFCFPVYATDELGSSNLQASTWALSELEKANQLGLIPDCLNDADLTKPITRTEFAAVAVKTYENLTGAKVLHSITNPFTDTNDAEVLKAYSVGITSGTAADKFSPDVLLNREQAATMLTRVLKAARISNWTLATDSDYTLNFKQPTKFADDDLISDWARSSVYFMAANSIILGTGNNLFSPRAVTPAEQAANYATATREQSLIIALRIVENLSQWNGSIQEEKPVANPLPITSPSQTDPQDSTIPPDGTIVGMAYMDPILKMLVILYNPEWIYSKDRDNNPSQVYFYNNVNKSDDKLISISSFSFSGDASKEIELLWEAMKQNHKNLQTGISFDYKDTKSIKVGDLFSGRLYAFEIKSGNAVIICNALFWATDEMIYTCTTSALAQDSKEVQDVLDGLLKSFKAM
jgi:hypothetical protein